MNACKDCGRAQVPATPAELDALQRDLERDGDYEVVERADGMLRLQDTGNKARPPFWKCAECLTKTEW